MQFKGSLLETAKKRGEDATSWQFLMTKRIKHVGYENAIKRYGDVEVIHGVDLE